jgi:hypothetical protein
MPVYLDEESSGITGIARSDLIPRECPYSREEAQTFGEEAFPR